MPKFKKVNDAGVEYTVDRGWWEKTREWAEYIFLGLTCGYGVRPWRPLGVGIALIVLSTLAYFNIGHYLRVRITPCVSSVSLPFGRLFDYLLSYFCLRGSLEHQRAEGDFIGVPCYPGFWDCFYFSIITFIGGTYGDLRPKGAFKVIVVSERLLGWLTMTFFVVTLSRVWMRH